jgi:hypothetical protein
MPGWTDLNAEMAACWKAVWNVEPLALSVPLSAALLLDEDDALLAGDEVPVEEDGEELDEEQAARVSAVATTATPAVAARCLRRCGISGFSLWVLAISGRDRRPWTGRSACKRWCAMYSLSSAGTRE